MSTGPGNAPCTPIRDPLPQRHLPACSTRGSCLFKKTGAAGLIRLLVWLIRVQAADWSEGRKPALPLRSLRFTVRPDPRTGRRNSTPRVGAIANNPSHDYTGLRPFNGLGACSIGRRSKVLQAARLPGIHAYAYETLIVKG